MHILLSTITLVCKNKITFQSHTLKHQTTKIECYIQDVFIFISRTRWINLSKCPHSPNEMTNQYPGVFSTMSQFCGTTTLARLLELSRNLSREYCLYSRFLGNREIIVTVYPHPCVQWWDSNEETRRETPSVHVQNTDTSGLQRESWAHLWQQHGWQHLMHTSQKFTKSNELKYILSKNVNLILVHNVHTYSETRWRSRFLGI